MEGTERSSSGKACAPCRNAHQSCDKKRPCGRCCRLHRTHLCRDPPPPFFRQRAGGQAKDDGGGGLPLSISFAQNACALSPRTQQRVAPPSRPNAATRTVPPSSSSFSSSASSAAMSSFRYCAHAPSSAYASGSSPCSFASASGCSSSSTPSDSFSFVPMGKAAQPPPRVYSFTSLSSTSFRPHDNGQPSRKRKHAATTHGNTNALRAGNESPSFASSSYSSSASSSSSFSLEAAACLDSEQLALPSDAFLSSTASSCVSSSLLSLQGNSSSASSASSTTNTFIRLWLSPITINPRRLRYSPMMYLSTAHPLECCVDDQLTEPWVMIRPFAIDSVGSSIIAVNSAFMTMYGYSQRDLLGLCFSSLIPDETIGALQRAYSKRMTQWSELRNCQLSVQDTCTIIARDGTWLMSHTDSTFYFGPDGGLLFIALRMKNTNAVQRNLAIQWGRQERTVTWKMSLRSVVALPRDVRFHEGSFFPTAPVASVEDVTGGPACSSAIPYSSTQEKQMPLPPSPSIISTSDCSTDALLDMLSAPTVDCRYSSSRLDSHASSSSSSCSFSSPIPPSPPPASFTSPSFSSSAVSMEPFSRDSAPLCEPVSQHSSSYPLYVHGLDNDNQQRTGIKHNNYKGHKHKMISLNN
ncbi:hypothetical protein QOT17_010380 [Balamuthia mandrillaris]